METYFIPFLLIFRMKMLLHSVMTSPPITRREKRKRRLEKSERRQGVTSRRFFENKFLFVDVKLNGLGNQFYRYKSQKRNEQYA